MLGAFRNIGNLWHIIGARHTNWYFEYRFEKEFDGVQDVFELQVWLSQPHPRHIDRHAIHGISHTRHSTYDTSIV
jgi:hypothetical protein